MSATISGSTGGGYGRIGTGISGDTRIEMLGKQLKLLTKKIAALNKQLMDCNDPELRKQLIKMIAEVQHEMLMIQQQIAQLQLAAQRRALHVERPSHQMAHAWDDADPGA
jgi:chromosome segregation ATPase